MCTYEEIDRAVANAKEAFATWGWRIPFLVSIFLLLISLSEHIGFAGAYMPGLKALTDRLEPGDTLLLEGVGGGFTWGAALIDF